MLNGVQITEQHRTLLADGDHFTIGPWTFRVRIGEDSGRMIPTDDDTGSSVPTLQAVTEEEIGTLAARRLRLLMDYASSIHSARDEDALADAVLTAALAGTGFSRAALVRPSETFDEVELIASHGCDKSASGAKGLTISRSLIRAASSGHVVRLTDQPELRYAASIAELGIQAGLCAPVHIGLAIGAYLYLDDRDGTTRSHSDAAAFCDALARMCGMAMGNLQRTSLEARQRRLEAQLIAAHDAQRRILPAERGRAGPIRYSMCSKPGQLVAGDLFDIIEIDDTHVAFFIGDVTGKGLGPALLMARAQAQIDMLLGHHHDPVPVIKTLNRDLCIHSAANEFITLWLAVLDAGDHTIDYVDAGHGYVLHTRSDQQPRLLRGGGGPPLGIDPDASYPPEHLPFMPGDKLTLLSDGLVEQRSPEGDEFGLERVIELLAGRDAVEDDVAMLLDALKRHARTDVLADDVTIASLWYDPTPSNAVMNA